MSVDTKNFLNKTINQDLIAENLNNAAPFRSLVRSIGGRKGKESALASFVNCTARRRNRPYCYFCFSDFLYPSQPRNSFSEGWDGGLNSGFFEHLPFKSLMPWMITPMQAIDRPDPITDLLSRKYVWNSKWTSYMQSYYKKKHRQTHRWFGKDVLYCPKVFVQMAEHFESNPDPFFSDIFNWYYAGEGNLHVVELSGSQYIIRSKFNCLYVSPFFKDTMSIDYTNTVTYECSKESDILETTHSQHFIALRTKYKVIILKLYTTEIPLKIERLKEMDSELPFTSIKFDQFHKYILYVTTLDYRLTIVNLDRMAGRSIKLRGKFTTLENNFNSVIAGERNNYAHITKKGVTLYDKRTNNPYQRFKSFKFISDIQSCAQIFSVKYCDRKPLMYVATDHHLYLMDIRSVSKEINMKPLQRWSHGMMNPPTYMDICSYDQSSNKEMVCLGSQWFEDMCLVNNYSDTLTRTEEIQGVSIPYRPPSLLNTFNEAHRKKLCYSLYDQIQNRLCTAISGLATVDRDDSTCILMQNSLGDISCHALYPEHMHAFIEDDSIEQLHEWCKDYKEEEKQFIVSYCADLRPFLKTLRRAPKDYVLGVNEMIKPKMFFDEKEIHDTFANEELDPVFMEIWKEKHDKMILDDTGSASLFFVDS